MRVRQEVQQTGQTLPARGESIQKNTELTLMLSSCAENEHGGQNPLEATSNFAHLKLAASCSDYECRKQLFYIKYLPNLGHLRKQKTPCTQETKTSFQEFSVEPLLRVFLSTMRQFVLFSSLISLFASVEMFMGSASHMALVQSLQLGLATSSTGLCQLAQLKARFSLRKKSAPNISARQARLSSKPGRRM